MADEVASLGFAVDSTPLDTAKQKLADVATQADKTGQSVDDFNQSVDKTAPIVGKLDAVAKQLGVTVDQLKAGIAGSKDGFVNLATSTQSAGAAIENLRTKLDGLDSSVKSSGVSSQQAANQFTSMTQGIASANRTIEDTGTKTQGMGAAITAAITRSTVSFGQMRQGIAAANTSLDQHKVEVEKAAEAHGHLSTQSMAAFHSVRSMAEGLAQGISPAQILAQQLNHLSYAASGPGGLTEAFAGAARMIGPTGLFVGGVAVLGAVAAALGKVNDEVERSKQRFAGLTGSVEGGAKAYDAVKAAAKASGIEVSTLAGAFEKAKIGQDEFADKNVTYANTAENSAKQSEKLAAALGTVGKIMQSNRDTAEEEKTELDALASSFQTAGALTVSAFQKIQQQSPATATSIARAFGYDKVTEFIKELGKAPITIEEFIQRMARVKPQVDEAFDPERPKTFSQALRETEQAGRNLLEALAKAGAGDVLTKLLVNTKDEVEALSSPIENLTKSFETFSSDATKSWTDFFTKSDESIFGWQADISGVVVKILATLGQLPGAGLASITSFVSGAIAEFQTMASAAISAAQQAVDALSKVGSAAAGAASAAGSALGGAINAAGGAGGTEGIQLGPSASDFSGGSSGGGGGSSSSSFTDTSGSSSGGNATGTIDYGGGSADYGYFADGGQFTVGGTGGTDSQSINFKATPGEVVTITTPDAIAAAAAQANMQSSGGVAGLTTIQGQPASGIVSATPDAASQATAKAITDAVSQSATDITKQIATGNNDILNALNKLIGGVASSTVNPATGLPVASTAGNPITIPGANGLSAFDQALITIKLGGYAGGGVAGGGGGGGSKPTPPPPQPPQSNQSSGDGLHIGGQSVPIRGFKGGTGFNSRAPLNPGIPTNPNYNPAYYGYQPLDPGMFDYLNSGSSAFDTGTSAYNDYGLSNFGYGSTGDYGVPGTGSSAYDTASQYMSSGGADYTSGGFGNDTGAINYGGGSSDAGYFATGGQFTVGGDGGTDTTPVFFHATKGEKVTITPPSGVVMPVGASASAPGAAPADPSQNNAASSTKTVNIYVSPGVQAESFLRSRAQIARGM